MTGPFGNTARCREPGDDDDEPEIHGDDEDTGEILKIRSGSWGHP
jgi:hypothetical protein